MKLSVLMLAAAEIAYLCTEVKNGARPSAQLEYGDTDICDSIVDWVRELDPMLDAVRINTSVTITRKSE